MSASRWRYGALIAGLSLLAGLGKSGSALVLAECGRPPVQAAAPAPAQASPQPAAASSGGAEEVVRALYRHVTFDRGRDVRWDDVKALFIPEAVIVLRSSRTRMTVYNPDGFVREFVKFVSSSKLEDRAFEESIVAIKTLEIGDVARAIVHYAARIPSEPRRPEQGIDVFLLMKKEGAWRIVSLVNELVRPGVPVPVELAAAPPAPAAGGGPTTSPGTGVEAPPPGGALVWYLGHCGYAVRTANHLLIFDYQEKRDGQRPKARPVRPSLASGWIDPREIRGLKVRVFTSHAHEDHYDPVISTWRATVPDIAYYFGWRAADNPADHYLVGPRAEITSGDVEIATINSHHSGVPEVAWLVKVDGLVIYHNGDCQPGDPRAEYSSLRTKTETIDLAFVPPVYEDGQKYTLQNAELFSRFRVRAAFPMHVQADDAMYHDFQRATRARFPDVTVRVPTAMGQKFVYVNGRIQDR